MIELIERFESFTSSVTKAYKLIQKIKIAEAEQIGLKPSHVMYMYYLGKNLEGLTHAQLSKLCIEDKAAVSRAIVELTQKGFVKNSEEYPSRKYRTKIILTDEGREINNNINKAIAIAVSKASKNLDEADRENFYRVFFYITDNLDEICSSYLKEK